jgi:hypothetical protein
MENVSQVKQLHHAQEIVLPEGPVHHRPLAHVTVVLMEVPVLQKVALGLPQLGPIIPNVRRKEDIVAVLLTVVAVVGTLHHLREHCPVDKPVPQVQNVVIPHLRMCLRRVLMEPVKVHYVLQAKLLLVQIAHVVQILGSVGRPVVRQSDFVPLEHLVRI